MRRAFPPLAVLAAALLCAAASVALAQDDLVEHRSCNYCGMDRKAYGYSRMLVRYEDGAAAGVCSLHCAVLELDANPGRKVKSLLVADRTTRELIEAEHAVWVMGGRKPGVMAQRAKWAFRSKAAADAFIRANAGEIVPWAEALRAAREDRLPKARLPKAR